jgi:hypothetical protein
VAVLTLVDDVAADLDRSAPGMKGVEHGNLIR